MTVAAVGHQIHAVLVVAAAAIEVEETGAGLARLSAPGERRFAVRTRSVAIRIVRVDEAVLVIVFAIAALQRPTATGDGHALGRGVGHRRLGRSGFRLSDFDVVQAADHGWTGSQRGAPCDEANH